MRTTRSSIKSVLQYEYHGILYRIGDAVELKEKSFGIIVDIQTTKEEITANIHEFTTEAILARMEFKGKKIKTILKRNELLYNTGSSRSISFKEIDKKVEISSKESSQYFCKRAIDIERGNIFDISWKIIEEGQDLFVGSPKKLIQNKIVLDDDETLQDLSDSVASDFEKEEEEDDDDESISSDVSSESDSVLEIDSDNDNDNDIFVENKTGPIKKRKLPKGSSKMDVIRANAKPVLRLGVKFNMNDIRVSRNIPQNATIYQKARDRLYLSYTPDSLPCRESEFDEIYMFLEGLIKAKSGACIYISGVPGTGKTATVYSVMNAFQKQMENKLIPHCELIEINGMKLTDPAQAYQLLWEGLSGKKVSSSHALELLTKRFSDSSSNEAPCIVLMDELDLLLTKNQKVIYNFFDWPNKPNSRLIVMAIANTMDLPERTLSNKVASRLEMKRITFQPYTHSQLVEIVKSRLASFNIFDPDAIELCARKVSSISGDARRALAICRRAIELLEESSLKLKKENISVKLIQKVMADMYTGPAVQSIRKASLHQRVFLVSMYRVTRSNGKQEVEFGEVCNEHERICHLKGLFCPTSRDLVSVASFMSSFHLIHCETNKMGDPYQKMRLIVSEDDLVMALRADKENEFLVKILEN